MDLKDKIKTSETFSVAVISQTATSVALAIPSGQLAAGWWPQLRRRNLNPQTLSTVCEVFHVHP